MNPVEKRWYAVYTKPRCEKKVADLLTKKAVQNYCPLNKIQKQWSDRKKIILEPLFTSYVFVKITMDERVTVLQTNGIINFVYWLSKPAVIRKEEIDIIKRFLNDHSFIKLEKTCVNINDVVRIVNGPFMEQEGQVFSVTKKTVKVMLPSLGYCMKAEVEINNVKVIQETIRRRENSFLLNISKEDRFQ